MIMLAGQLLLLLFYSTVHAGLNDLCGLNCGPTERPIRHFYVYWNVPTFMCHKYDVTFEEVAKFGITQNGGDAFHGDQITILYDPGYFPAMMPTGKDKYKKRNGGLPQVGDIAKHLKAFTADLNQQVPDKNFSGIGVIDFERWKPILRQNWGNQKIHKEMSIDLVKKNHYYWSSAIVESEATRKFEKYARFFMEETLNLAKKSRFRGDWGYYGYPYCYNYSPGNPTIGCDAKTMAENDRISWLFEHQDVLLPSVYVKYFQQPKERAGLVRGRVKEAYRIANSFKHHPRVLPYWWFKYTDQSDVYLSEKDVKSTIREILLHGGDGMIIWGSSSDVDESSKCKSLRHYLVNLIGPVVQKALAAANEGQPLDL